MFHLAAFSASVAASQTNLAMAAVLDGLLSIANSRFLLPEKMTIDRAFGLGLGLTDVRFTIPSLRAVAQPRVYPLEKLAAPGNDPAVNIWGQDGPAMLQTEGIGVEVTTDATAGPNQTFVLAWFRKMFRAPLPGPSYTIKATGAAVAAAGTWAASNLTLEQDLPSGNYQLVGADGFGTNVLAFRFRFPSQTYMPGVLAQQAAGEFFATHQRNGQMGVFGEFTNTQLPTVEVLGLGATAAQSFYLDIKKIG